MATTDRDAINSAMGGSQDPNQDDYQSAMGGYQSTPIIDGILRTGFWNDIAAWNDADVWKDAA